MSIITDKSNIGQINLLSLIILFKLLIEEICLLNILLDFSPNNLFAMRLCTIVNWAGPKKL